MRHIATIERPLEDGATRVEVYIFWDLTTPAPGLERFNRKAIPAEVWDELDDAVKTGVSSGAFGWVRRRITRLWTAVGVQETPAAVRARIEADMEPLIAFMQAQVDDEVAKTGDYDYRFREWDPEA